MPDFPPLPRRRAVNLENQFPESSGIAIGCPQDEPSELAVFPAQDEPSELAVFPAQDEPSELAVFPATYADEDSNRERTPLQGGGGDNMDLGNQPCTIYDISETPLNHAEVEDILRDPDYERVSFVPPAKPRGGEIYLISTGGDVAKKDDWRCDQYQWNNRGVRQIGPANNRVLRKMHFNVRVSGGNSSEFVKQGYQLMDRTPTLTLVQYLGDETVYKPLSHQNRKSGKAEHRRTCPSVLQKAKASSMTENPSSGYRRMVTDGTSSVYQGVLNPRNLKQVRNHQEVARKDKRLTHDGLYNTLELAYHLDGFVWEMTIYPDLLCVFGLPDMVEQLDKLLQLQDNVDNPVSLSYDVTFQLGDYYLSVLVFRHSLFENSPIMPVAFMIHDRKFQSVHETFFNILLKQLPRLKKCRNLPIIIDREKALFNAIQKILPNVTVLLCWNHIKRDLAFWLRRHGASPDDISVYKNQVEQLLHCDSEEVFKEKEAKFKEKWSPVMTEYFDDHLRTDLMEHACKWVIETSGLYNPFSGVTNNISESMNTVIKRLVEWREIPVDAILLALHYLQNYYHLEVSRGLAGLGNYNLRASCSFAARTVDDIKVPVNSCNPDSIVNLVRAEMVKRSSAPEPTTQSHGEMQQEVEDDDMNIPNQHTGKVTATNARTAGMSQKSLAICAVQNNAVTHVPERAAFVVEGNKGVLYAVKLFPKEKCQCPATGTCYHILAARISIGMETSEVNRRYNLTALRKNTRKTVDKKSGRKRPRVNDLDVTAAPNSEEGKYQSPGSIANVEDSNISFLTPPTCKKSKLNPSRTKPAVFQRKYMHFRNKMHESTILANGGANSHNVDTVGDNLPTPLKTSTPQTVNKDPPKSILKTPQSKCSVRKSLRFEGTDHEAIVIDSMDSFEVLELDEAYLTQSKKNQRYWKEHLKLTFQHKDQILHDSQWLNDAHIAAVSEIIKEQFPEISGLQHSVYAPIYYINKTDNGKSRGYWDVTNKLVKCAPPSAQIHHNGTNHWLLSVRTPDDDSVYILDSMYGMRAPDSSLTTSVKLQLCQIYDKCSANGLEVKVSAVPRQPNSKDCGVFAIAFLVEFCVNRYVGQNTLRFDVERMREHLLLCIERESFTPFPKLKLKKLGKHPSPVCVSIPMYCYCKLPEEYGYLVTCCSCSSIYHWRCVWPNLEPSEDKWVCMSCLKS